MIEFMQFHLVLSITIYSHATVNTFLDIQKSKPRKNTRIDRKLVQALIPHNHIYCVVHTANQKIWHFWPVYRAIECIGLVFGGERVDGGFLTTRQTIKTVSAAAYNTTQYSDTKFYKSTTTGRVIELGLVCGGLVLGERVVQADRLCPSQIRRGKNE